MFILEFEGFFRAGRKWNIWPTFQGLYFMCRKGDIRPTFFPQKNPQAVDNLWIILGLC